MVESLAFAIFRDLPELYPQFFKKQNSETMKNQKLQFALENSVSIYDEFISLQGMLNFLQNKAMIQKLK